MLKEEQLQLKEFFVEGKRQEESYVLLHISDPSTREEKHKGHFFVLYEANHTDQPYIQNLQKLIEQTGAAYYKELNETNEKALETALGIINNQAEHLIDPTKVIHCVIGVITPEELLFSFSNEPYILLYYKNKQGSYQTMDLVKNNTTASEQSSETKKVLFSQIIQGKLGAEDRLLLATHEVTKHVNLEYLKYLITSKPAEDSCQLIENILIKSRSLHSFGGLIIQHSQERAVALSPKSPPHHGSEKSLQDFFATEKNTAQTLSSSFGHHLAQRIGSHMKPSATTTTPLQKTMGPTASSRQSFFNASYSTTTSKIPSTPKGPLQYSINLLKKISTTIVAIVGSITLSVLSILKGLFLISTNLGGHRKEILTTWQKQWRGYTENIKQLPLITKLLLIGSCILIITFITSILYIHIHNTQKKVEQAYQEQLTKIQNSKTDVESILMYDEKTAKQKLVETENLLKQLPCSTKEQKQICDELNKSLEEISIKLKKIVKISPELLVAWPLETTPALDGLIKIKNKLLGFTSNKNTLYIYDLTTRDQHSLEVPLAQTGLGPAAVPKENDYAAFLVNKNELIEFNPENETIKKVDISFPEDQPQISSLTTYNRRLYSLDTTHNQIYRHDTTTGGFSRGQQWIKDLTSDLKDGVSLTIDGDLFVLKNNGQLIKLTKGAPVAFAIQGLDPALTAPRKVWTYNELKYIYVLEAQEKRLILLDKEGRLIKQITANEFENPHDMVIDEENKTAYLLDKNRIFKITLPI